MHVSPVPTRTSRRHGGRRAVLPVVVPIAALFLTVTVALAGRVLEGSRDPGATQADVAAAHSASPSPARTGRTTPTPAPAATVPGTPTTAYRLPVQTVPELLSASRAAAAGGHLVAVSGSFTLDPRVSDCPAGRSLADSFCERQGLLASSPRPLLAVDDNGIAPEAVRLTVAVPSLGVRVPVGVALPTVIIWASAVQGVVQPVPAVVIGRLEAAVAVCASASTRCLPTLVLERVAWIAGEWSDGVVVRSASIPADPLAHRDRGARVIATREVDRGEPILGRALLMIDDLRLVDADAAGAITADVGGPVWYVRSVGRRTEPGGPRVVAWAVVDQRTGLVLGSGASASS